MAVCTDSYMFPSFSHVNTVLWVEQHPQVRPALPWSELSTVRYQHTEAVAEQGVTPDQLPNAVQKRIFELQSHSTVLGVDGATWTPPQSFILQLALHSSIRVSNTAEPAADQQHARRSSTSSTECYM